MLKSKVKQRVYLFIAAIVAALIAVSAGLVITPAFNKPAEAATTTHGRVEMKDLFLRYNMDAVIGPIDAVDTNNDGKIDRNDMDETGHFTYKSTNIDVNGNPTNNIYGIPASRYFDVESYIFTKEDTAHQYTDSNGNKKNGRILYGWKPAIRAVNPGEAHKTTPGAADRQIAENGEILVGGQKPSTAQPIGIYVRYNGLFYGTTFKYALVVPDDVTSVGQGSAAFVGYSKDTDTKLTTYYRSKTTYVEGTAGAVEFTDFGNFLNLDEAMNDAGAPYFWQPRERLAGVFFSKDSALQEIVGGTQAASDDEKQGSNQSSPNGKGKSAFTRCNNLRFMVLPGENGTNSGLKTIGNYAFYLCSQIVDINIPSSVTTIGTKAFAECTGVYHLALSENIESIGTDAFIECSKLKHVDNNTSINGSKYTTNLPTTNKTLYVLAGRPENGVVDQGRGGVIITQSGSTWSAVGFAGEAGESSEKVFVLPSGSDFNDSSDRRIGVKYDYLDSDGIKVKNSLNANVTTYDIADNFAYETWCRNIVLPKEVKKIGKNAFYRSHVIYLETYATDIGAQAFNDDGTLKETQWFYFHQIKNSSGNYVAYTFRSSDTFSTPPSGRHIVFSNYELYNTIKLATEPTTGYANLRSGATIHYQVPVAANINNADTGEYTFGDSDIPDRFFNDPDYDATIFDENGNIKVGASGSSTTTYTKRLSGYSFDQVKQRTGGWTTNSSFAAKHKKPTLSNMTKTEWFTSADYSVSTDASKQYTPASSHSVTIYTKNIARPQNIKSGDYDGVYKGKYVFGETYTFGSNSKTLGDNDSQNIDFSLALGLSSDYVINPASVNGFVFPNNATVAASDVKNIHHAGTYNLNVTLNSKWGEWSKEFIADNPDYLTAQVTVERKVVDYSSIDKFPQFENRTDNRLNGDAIPLYRYNDGWYLSMQNGEEPRETRPAVTNSYFYYTEDSTGKAQDKFLTIDGETGINWNEGTSRLGDVYITSRNGTVYAASGDYVASFTFQLLMIEGFNNQSDYVFYYGDDENAHADTAKDEAKGLTISNKQNFSFRVTKVWYIVKETNMFTLAEGEANAYSPAYRGTTATTGVDSWTYADNTVNFRNPELYHIPKEGNADIKFTIDYTPVNGSKVRLIKDASLNKAENATGAETLGYYFNSSMPAGSYDLTLSVGAVTDKDDKTYPAISGVYTVVVAPKAFEQDLLDEFNETVRGSIPTESGYKNEYPIESKKLHDDITVIKGKLDAALNVSPDGKALTRSGYWAPETANAYYSTAVAVTYNLDGSGNTLYYNERGALARAPYKVSPRRVA